MRWKSTSQGMVGRRPRSLDEVVSPTRIDNDALSHDTSAADLVMYQNT